MIIKVFVLVQGDKVDCYHDLKQLTEANSLPYFKVRRRMARDKYYKDDGILIRSSVMRYNSNKGGRHELRE